MGSGEDVGEMWGGCGEDVGRMLILSPLIPHKFSVLHKYYSTVICTSCNVLLCSLLQLNSMIVLILK